MCIVVAAIDLQRTDRPQSRARMATLLIERQGLFTLAGSFVPTRDLKQQLRAPALQPFVIQAGSWKVRKHLMQRLLCIESAPAFIEPVEVVDILTGLKRAGFPGKRHGLVAENAEISQHELRPFLPEIPKEQEPKLRAQRRHIHHVNRLARSEERRV